MILLGNAAHFSWNSAYLLDSLRVMMREGTQLGVMKKGAVGAFGVNF